MGAAPCAHPLAVPPVHPAALLAAGSMGQAAAAAAGSCSVELGLFCTSTPLTALAFRSG